MVNIILVGIVCVALGLSIFIEVYSLFWSKSYKKNYFLLMQAMIIVYLFGYLLELTSSHAEEAYTGIKILYVGSYFTGVFAFFFIADYLNFRIHLLYVKVPMVLLAIASVLIMWTTKYHHLVYRNYSFETGYYHHLAFAPGALYSVIHTYPTICMLMAMGLLVYQLKRWRGKYRRQLLIFLLCVAIPFIAEGIYYITIITKINVHQIYFTPHSMAIMSFFLYIGVIRYNLFEVISIATVSAMDHIREGFVLVDEDDNYLSCNPEARKILPGIKELMKGETIFSAAGWPEELNPLESGTVEFPIAGEETRYYRASISPVLAHNKTLVGKIILIRDTTESVVLMKELENAAYMDALTGLYNRKHFTKLALVDIERALRSDQSIYAAMLDLDFFKNVNDTYGHAAGDLVLKVTAGIIRQTIRSYDLLGRYGGEEFVLLITDLDASEACKLMERIRENMEHCAINYEGQEIKITCSIGLAKFTSNDTLETSVKKADEALYIAKKSGRNQVQVHGF